MINPNDGTEKVGSREQENLTFDEDKSKWNNYLHTATGNDVDTEKFES